MRVQIPAYTDRWMMGDRFGEVVKISRKALAKPGIANAFAVVEIAHVKLDISGKTLKFIIDDCTVV